MAEPAIRAESEGLLGRAWRGIAAKNGQDVKRRQTAIAFAVLYDEQQTESKEQCDEDNTQSTDSTRLPGGNGQYKECSKRAKGEGTEQHGEGHERRNDEGTRRKEIDKPRHDDSQHAGGDQDRRDKLDSKLHALVPSCFGSHYHQAPRADLSHDSVVIKPEGQGGVTSLSVRTMLRQHFSLSSSYRIRCIPTFRLHFARIANR